MTKELQEFKEKCLKLTCKGYNFDCKDCPLNINIEDCELYKFRRIVRERFKPKLCPTCGKENE